MKMAPETLSPLWFNDAFRAFNQLPFAEDRYIRMHHMAKTVNSGVSAAALEEIVIKSDCYFWVMQAGELPAGNNTAKRAAARVFELTSIEAALPDFMPVEYPSPSQQITPEAAMAWAKDVA